MSGVSVARPSEFWKAPDERKVRGLRSRNKPKFSQAEGKVMAPLFIRWVP